MNRRALAVALLLAVVGTVLLLLYQNRFETEASGGERVEVLMAARDIEPGSTLTDEMLLTRRIPIAYMEDRAVKATDRKRLLGLKTSTSLHAQQTVLWTDILSSGEQVKELSSLIRPGYLAMPIRLAREDTNTALIRPGDYVDVIGVFAVGDRSTAAVLLQRVLVLASGTETTAARDPENKSASRGDNSVTLSVTPRDAQMIALAISRGRLTAAVRRVDDTRVIDVQDMSSDALLGKQRAAARPAANAPGGPTQLQSVVGGN